ncbi:MAG: hypothetical protein QHJ82_11195, partial [Verrucomicrobiota bacterium]|nr:hypothetical protein [Verrucomicrobiota bacterium]
PTFAGIDYLVLGAAFAGTVSLRMPTQRLRVLGVWLLLICAAHVAYLSVAAAYPFWSKLLPTVSVKPAFPGSPPGTKPLGEMLLWNLPLVGLLLHGSVTAFTAKYIGRRVVVETGGGSTSIRSEARPARKLSAEGTGRIELLLRPGNRWQVAAALLCMAVPAVTLLNPRPLSLEGRKIVVYEKGFLNWLKPKHGEYGRLSVGMYGLWPAFCQSYGAQCVISPDLSETDLNGADLLVLIFPNRPWEQDQLFRIWRYVRNGGTLLVLGEHTVQEKGGGNRFNDVLEPTSMRVAFDSAMFAVGGWLNSYEAFAHPASLGIRDDRNQFGVVIGASVEAKWPARPLILGRYGWADPGDTANDESRGGSMMGNQKYDGGERIGDLLLAAEQRLGHGRVVVFGDTSGFTNGILYGSHQYVAALLASLCNRSEFGVWRTLVTGIGLLLLGWLLTRSCSLECIVVAGLLFAGSATACAMWTARMANLLPDGRRTTPNSLAYIDTTHLERVSGESWRLNGLGGLHLTLVRNGYLVLGLPEFTEERLQRAGLLFSAVPGKAFSARERAAVRRFIENGGIFIITVGWPESAASRSLLSDLEFYVGGIQAAEGGGTEPRPFGHFKAPYFNGGDYMAYVRFHAAWPVESSAPDAQPLAYGPRDALTRKDPAVILMRHIGRGKVIVVADSEFATNQNLEHEGGQPFEGLRENADFWRWLLAYVNDQPAWNPPRPSAQNAPISAPQRNP